MLTKEEFWDRMYRLDEDIITLTKLRCKLCAADRNRRKEKLIAEYTGIYI